MVNIAVFVSGYGSNLSAIIQAVNDGLIRANIALVVSDNKEAYALKRARDAGIKHMAVEPVNYASKAEFEKAVLQALVREKVGLVVLAGFMRILSAEFVSAYRNKILNVHPSLLPAFKGEDAIRRAFDYGVKVSGVTVHFVDEKMDHGPVISQKQVIISDGEALESFEKRIHAIEHELYPEAIALCVEGRLKIEGRKVTAV